MSERTDRAHGSAETTSAYQRAADQNLDPRVVPIKLDGPVPEGEAIAYPSYPPEDQETWRILFERQSKLLEGVACDEYLEGLGMMAFPPDRIPALRDVHHVLKKTTGWGIARIPGLLHEQDFFSFLSRRVFPSTDYIRPRHELDYTPAPDLFHDIFGHTPMITLPSFADFYQRIGQAALRAQGKSRRRLERFYWFTVEFGLIRTPHGMRIYGNGILSSYNEVRHSLTEEVKVLPFDPEVITEQDYDVWKLQPLLFAIDSFTQLADGFDDWARKEKLF